MNFKSILNVFLFITGLTLVIGGLLLFIYFSDLLQDEIKKEMPLKYGARSFKRWQKPKSSITAKFYFFHLKNTKTFTSLDDIELVEKGPYTYNVQNIKRIINNSDDHDDWISYREKKKYTFIKDYESDLDENDEINVINFPILGMLQTKLDHFKRFLEMAFNVHYLGSNFPNETGLFIKTRVVDLLFNGLTYDLFDDFILNRAGVPDRFSILKAKERYEKEKTINTGKHNLGQIYQIIKYNGRSNLINEKFLRNEPIWPNYNTADNNCNQLKGTDGKMFAPDIFKKDTLFVFEPKMCRSVYFKYWKETEVQNIKTYRFRIPNDYFYNPLKRRKNSCYCLEDELDKCDQDGILDISHCLSRSMGAPIIVSLPYFLKANKHLRKQFGSELVPKKDLNYENYGVYFDVEPRTGYTLNGVKRLQFNLKVKRQYIETMPKLNNSEQDHYIVPIFWVEKHGSMSEAQSDEYDSEITKYERIGYGSSIGFITLGIIMQLTSIYIMFKLSRTKKNNEIIIKEQCSRL